MFARTLVYSPKDESYAAGFCKEVKISIDCICGYKLHFFLSRYCIRDDGTILNLKINTENVHTNVKTDIINNNC